MLFCCCSIALLCCCIVGCCVVVVIEFVIGGVVIVVLVVVSIVVDATDIVFVDAHCMLLSAFVEVGESLLSFELQMLLSLWL